MQNEPHWLGRAASTIFAAILLGFVLINASDLVGYMRSPESYHIGSEAMGFRYRSVAHLFTTTVGSIIVGLAALGLPIVCSSMSRGGRPSLIRGATCFLLLVETCFQLLTLG